MNAGYFAVCGQKDIAVRLIKDAIAGHYCPYTDTCRTMPCSPACGARRSLLSYSPAPNSAAMIFLPKDRKPRTESS